MKLIEQKQKSPTQKIHLSFFWLYLMQVTDRHVGHKSYDSNSNLFLVALQKFTQNLILSFLL